MWKKITFNELFTDWTQVLSNTPQRIIWGCLYCFYALAGKAQHSMQRGHYVFSLSVQLSCLSVSLSVSCQHRLPLSRAGHRPAGWPATTQDGRRPARCPCGRLHSRANMDSSARPFRCKNGTIRRAGKSIMQMLLQVHQVTGGGLQLCRSHKPGSNSSLLQ